MSLKQFIFFHFEVQFLGNQVPKWTEWNDEPDFTCQVYYVPAAKYCSNDVAGLYPEGEITVLSYGALHERPWGISEKKKLVVRER